MELFINKPKSDMEYTLDSASSEATPGDTLRITSHNEKDVTWTVSGEPDKPIVLILSNLFPIGKRFSVGDSGTILKDVKLLIEADYVTLIGGEFENSLIEVSGNNNVICGCRFFNGKDFGIRDKLYAGISIVENASHNLIGNCVFEDWHRRGITQTKIRINSRGNKIDSNHFRNMIVQSPKNGDECIQVGSGPNDCKYSPMTSITYNLIENYNLDSETISLKSNNNLVHGNTFVKTTGICCRTGSENTISGNRLIDSGNIDMFGNKNRVIGNRLVNSGIVQIRSGDCKAEQLWEENSPFQGGHPAAIGTEVVSNIVDEIVLGRRGTGSKMYYDKQHFAATNTRLYGNSGEVADHPNGKVENVVNLNAVPSYAKSFNIPKRRTKDSVGRLNLSISFDSESETPDHADKVVSTEEISVLIESVISDLDRIKSLLK